ncbi:MAG: hypothetical protein JJ953_11900 [Gracilimonas sp.]|uniref:hypothetical protein n=1 Tax=Gracilimonas TaxID=649462 RepID=UPI001B1AD0ED|nr:hypothetical protein [Gracilimonas sp.]MBO6586801.1 hypothetical protein [Gracilimonas sp.]MBO6615458.1 hypothetical protein [Gracilimonas sp.]
MKNEKVVLEVKKGWKIYQLIAGVICIGAVGYLFYGMTELWEYMGKNQALLFGAIMILFCLGMLYTMFYSFRHHIEFDNEKMTRYGVINSKVIYYKDMEELCFTDRYWQFSATGKVLGNPKAYLIDTKYQDKEKAIAYLKQLFKEEDHPILVA